MEQTVVFAYRYSVLKAPAAHEHDKFFQAVDVLDDAAAIPAHLPAVKRRPLGRGCPRFARVTASVYVLPSIKLKNDSMR